MIALVLAAGFGTRLRPLTDRLAKPALPLLGTTLLALNLRLARRAGATEVVVNAHHLPATVAGVARAEAAALSLRLHLCLEAPRILGTGGALVAARPLLDRGAPFLLVNGDVLSDLDPAAAVRAHHRTRAVATLVLRPMPAGASFAPVDVDEGGRVARIAGQGRELSAGERLTPHLFTGVHVLSPEIFEVLPPSGEACVNRQGHARLLARGAHLHAHVDPGGSWSDVGTPERYLDANLELLEGRIRREATGDVWGGAQERAPGIRVHPSAVVEPGAVLEPPCFVGAGAFVGRSARLGPGAVVLAGARVDGELRRAVVAPFASLRAGELAEGTVVMGGEPAKKQAV